MLKTPRRRRLVDAYAFPGFRAGAGMRGRFGDPQMRIVTLARRAKKRAAALVGRGCFRWLRGGHLSSVYHCLPTDKFVSFCLFRMAVRTELDGEAGIERQCLVF